MTEGFAIDRSEENTIETCDEARTITTGEQPDESHIVQELRPARHSSRCRSL